MGFFQTFVNVYLPYNFRYLHKKTICAKEIGQTIEVRLCDFLEIMKQMVLIEFPFNSESWIGVSLRQVHLKTYTSKWLDHISF